MSIVFLFPGQGSQKLNMLADYQEHYPIIKQTFEEASDSLGFDVWEICANEEKLAQTQYTQPSILTASIAIWRLWKSVSGKTPKLLAGHSLGEYSALVAAEVLELKDAVKLVHNRGRLMQEAVADGIGAMAAVLGKADEKVADLCEQVSTDDSIVSAANFNCQGQVVVSGHATAVQRLKQLAEDEGFKMMVLPVSVPSHCGLMLPAAQELKSMLDDVDFKAPKIPVVQNLDAKVHDDVSKIKEALVLQLSEPVQWKQTMQYIQANGITSGVECGPGKVLTGLAKRQKLDFSVNNTDTVTAFDLAITKV